MTLCSRLSGGSSYPDQRSQEAPREHGDTRCTNAERIQKLDDAWNARDCAHHRSDSGSGARRDPQARQRLGFVAGLVLLERELWPAVHRPLPIVELRSDMC
jgi:hypothetical protein